MEDFRTKVQFCPQIASVDLGLTTPQMFLLLPFYEGQKFYLITVCVSFDDQCSLKLELKCILGQRAHRHNSVGTPDLRLFWHSSCICK